MTKLSFRPPILFLLGFDQLERLVERTAKVGTEVAIPPFNIEQSGVERLPHNAGRCRLPRGTTFRSPVEDRQLGQRPRAPGMTRPRAASSLHRGIAARAFQKGFVLADGVTRSRARRMENGLLHIDLAGARCPRSVVTQTILHQDEVRRQAWMPKLRLSRRGTGRAHRLCAIPGSRVADLPPRGPGCIAERATSGDDLGRPWEMPRSRRAAGSGRRSQDRAFILRTAERPARRSTCIE